MTAERSDPAAALAAQLDEAAAALDAAAGSASLCTLSRAGVPMPGIKYPEGAWSALRDVAREARGIATSARRLRPCASGGAMTWPGTSSADPARIGSRI